MARLCLRVSPKARSFTCEAIKANCTFTLMSCLQRTLRWLSFFSHSRSFCVACTGPRTKIDTLDCSVLPIIRRQYHPPTIHSIGGQYFQFLIHSIEVADCQDRCCRSARIYGLDRSSDSSSFHTYHITASCTPNQNSSFFRSLVKPLTYQPNQLTTATAAPPIHNVSTTKDHVQPRARQD